MDHDAHPLRLLRPVDAYRVVLGWATFAALTLASDALAPPAPAAALIVALATTIGVIVVCAFGVVHQAEALARRLGDPYGSLVLTLSIVLIEVILISAVILGPGTHSTIGRDSIMAVSMIILNLVIGLSLVVAGRRHDLLRINRRGTVAYLGMITVLGTLGFALPRWIGTAGEFSTAQAVPVIAVTVVGYTIFLYRQMGPRADDFREVVPLPEAATSPTTCEPAATTGAEIRPAAGAHTSGTSDPAGARGVVVTRLAVIVATMVPIVLLSQDMAALLDDGLGRLGAPVALSGVLIAMVVFLPEALTSVRAALGAELQRVSNLCHGALVSTLALSIPAVLTIGLVTGDRVVFAESTTNLVLLGVTVALSWFTFTRSRLTTGHGVAHLVLFGVYAVTLVT